MAFVTYVEHDGTEHTIDVPNGNSVMLGAVSNGIHGIVGECGGGLACATCLCFVDSAWIESAGAQSEMEIGMLEGVEGGDKPGSRLSCQITVSNDLDGLIVRLPESQY